ncbi:MAG: DUF5067 domain-containing protein [Prevotellaceae bacterium]|nr:DUF5067 domain-containing protein [Prevotellaceae bacterium]
MENVAQEKVKKNNKLGVAALIVAIVALAGSWVPLMNIFSIISAIVGIILGIWSFANVLTKKSGGMALPILAAVISVGSIVMAYSMNNHVFGSGDSSKTSNSDSDTSSNAKVDEAKNPEIADTKGTLGQYDVEILSARMAQKNKYNDEDIVIITYKFTNNSDKDASFGLSLKSQIFQNGQELDTAFLTTISEPDLKQTSSNDVKTGFSIEVDKCYKLKDKSPVTVEVEPYFDFTDSSKVTRTFDLS